MARGIVKAPGVNLLHSSDTRRRLRTLRAGTRVDVRGGRRWLRVEAEGVAGLVPAAAIEMYPSGPLLPGAPGVRGARKSGLRPLRGCSRFIGEPVVAHVDFHAALRRLDGYADLVGARIYVSHSFRRRDSSERDAVIPLSKRSNHLVGHAIDMNIVLPREWIGSNRLSRGRLGELPLAARQLIEQIRGDAELRWGGDFLRPDPVHVDDDLYRRDPEQWTRKLSEV